MLISIIVPVYQAEKYIKRLMESMIPQCGRGFEVLLIDDGSTDDGPRICDAYAERYSFVRVIHRENEGVSAARNAGLDEARGDYVMFADADDEYPEDALTGIRKACMAGGWDLLVFDHCRIQRKASEDAGLVYSGPVPVQTVRDNFSDYLYAACANPVWNKVFIRTVIEEHQLRFPDMKIGEDAYFCYSYLKYCGSLYFEKMVLYRHYQNSGSAVNRYCASRLEDANRLIALLEELALEWGYTQPQTERLMANKYRNALLQELYNVLSADCPMGYQEASCYLKKIVESYRKANRWELITEEGLERSVRFQLSMLRHRMVFLLLCLMRGKRLLRGG